jgi:hypothetical protein
VFNLKTLPGRTLSCMSLLMICQSSFPCDFVFSFHLVLPPVCLCHPISVLFCTTLFSVLFADDTTGLSKGKKLDDLLSYVAAKTKFIIFRTHGKYINNNDCTLLFNDNEIGLPEDPSLIYPIERVYNDGPTKSFKGTQD